MLKKLKPIILEGFRTRLSTQLIISFLGMFLILLLIISIFSYEGFLNILKYSSEKHNIDQFKQNEYNIDAFCNEVDKVSRLIIINADLKSLSEYNSLSDINRVLLISDTYQVFSQMLSNYNYIDSIIYYGEDGLSLKATLEKNSLLYDERKDNWFYNSEIHQLTMDRSLKLTWFGGYNLIDFDVTEDGAEIRDKNPGYYITAARSVFSGRHSGTLIINVKMDYFTSIYNSADEEDNGTKYIINNSGKIISHKDETEIGRQSPVFSIINLKNGGNDLILESGNEKRQIIYYKMNNSGWMIINEVSMYTLTKDVFTMRRIVVIMCMIGSFLAFVLSRYWIRRITRPLVELTAAMIEVERGSLGIEIKTETKNEIDILIGRFNRMSKSIFELVRQNEAIQKNKRDAEIQALQSQINPHFLYNTLNCIKWMAAIRKADNIVESLTTLSNFLHPIFKSHEIMWSLKEEIHYLQNYVKIMNYRFAEGIKVSINLPGELLGCEIIRFILQPLVENAIYHGLANKNGGEIGITALENRDNTILLKVSDNGKGMTDEKLEEINAAFAAGASKIKMGESGIGLVNVNFRIRLHFGDKYGIEIDSKRDIGTEVIMKLPNVQKS